MLSMSFLKIPILYLYLFTYDKYILLYIYDYILIKNSFQIIYILKTVICKDVSLS